MASRTRDDLRKNALAAATKCSASRTRDHKAQRNLKGQYVCRLCNQLLGKVQ